MGLENGFTVHRKAVKVMARLVSEWPENRKDFFGIFFGLHSRGSCWNCTRFMSDFTFPGIRFPNLRHVTLFPVCSRVGHGISHKSLPSHKSHKSRDGTSSSKIGTCGICGTFSGKNPKKWTFSRFEMTITCYQSTINPSRNNLTIRGLS